MDESILKALEIAERVCQNQKDNSETIEKVNYNVPDEKTFAKRLTPEHTVDDNNSEPKQVEQDDSLLQALKVAENIFQKSKENQTIKNGNFIQQKIPFNRSKPRKKRFICQASCGQIYASRLYDRIDFNSYRDKFFQSALRAHNNYRLKHDCEPLVLNEQISIISQGYADHLASIDQIFHSNNTFMSQDLGENLYSFDIRDGSITGERVTSDWYNENLKYNFNDFQYGTGHFTQLVWKSSKDIGFGLAISNNGRVYFVVNYYPTGNVIGKFHKNVSRPLN